MSSRRRPTPGQADPRDDSEPTSRRLEPQAGPAIELPDLASESQALLLRADKTLTDAHRLRTEDLGYLPEPLANERSLVKVLGDLHTLSRTLDALVLEYADAILSLTDVTFDELARQVGLSRTTFAYQVKKKKRTTTVKKGVQDLRHHLPKQG